MVTPRWRKILADLWGNKARTLLVALSIAVGIFAVGVVSTAYFILSTDVKTDFLAANPHDAMIFSDLFDDNLLIVLQHVPGVDQIRGVGSISGQITIPGNQKVGIQIYMVPRQLDEVQLDKVFLLSGSPQLKEKEVYIDRGSFAPLGVKEGDEITVELGRNQTRSLRVVGVVHDAYTNGYLNARSISAYVSPETMEWLGGSRLYNQVVFTTKDGPKDVTYSREVADRVSEKIEKSGRESYGSLVYPPGDHPGQSTINTVLLLLAGMGVLVVFLSTFLVINTISALLNQQVRQIGVMKAVGATAWQVMGMYLVLILLFGVLALILAVPGSVVLGYMMAQLIVDLLNSTLGPMRLPQPSLILMLIVGLGVPLFAGLVPVINGSRLTVREAISNYGLSAGKRGFFDRMLETVRGLPRPLLLSLRNTFRRKARLLLTLSTLTLAGAIFIAVFNVRDAMYVSIETTYGYLLSDVNTAFNRPYRLERIHSLIDDIPGIVAVEGWGESGAQVLKPDGKTVNEVQIYAPPAGSQLIKPVLTAGRWLVAGDDRAVVVGNHFTKIRPDVKVGDTIKVRINNKDYPFEVVGIYEIAGTFLKPPLYMNAETLARLKNQAGLAASIRVQTDLHDPVTQQRVAKAIDARLKDEGIQTAGTITGTELAAQTRVTIDILIYVLLFMVVLIAFVGGLGLMGTMSMNVMERTREIGVMRSIGAVDAAIMQLVLVEGMMIGAISWGIGAVFSIPITHGMDNMLGVSLLNVPLRYSFSVSGLITWLVLVIILATVACILPARNAVRLTVRDVLAYE